MKTYFKVASLLLFSGILLTLGACNKTKTNSNKLIKAGEWTVTELSVNGTNEAELPSWHIEECDIYAESCHAEWENEEGGHSEFVWQFREKGKTFEISRQEGEHGHGAHNHADEEANAQCYAFSGVYEVVESKKKSMEFKSTSTLGHSSSTVVIKIEKK